MTRRSDPRLMQAIAQRAAKLMAENGITSYNTAKLKAVQQLGLSRQCRLPANQDIESALMEYQRLFLGEAQTVTVQRMRGEALKAMDTLRIFSPRLAGPVLEGTAIEDSTIFLHVFSDTPEDIAQCLMEQGVSYELAERRLRTSPKSKSKSHQNFPAYRFLAGEMQFEIVVFPHNALGHPPLSPVTHRPMPRADTQALSELLVHHNQDQESPVM